MSLAQWKTMDFSNLEPKEGWTLKEVLAVFEEHRQQIQFHIEKRARAIELAIERFTAMKAQIAALPSAVKEMPYFDFINMDHNVPVLDASEVKKRSRMEWEESVRTRTGKRPRRGAQSSGRKRSYPSSAVKRGTVPESVTLNLQSIMETEREPTSTKRTAVSVAEISANEPPRTATRSRGAKVPRTMDVVASTPASEKPPVFAIPTTARMTRSRITKCRLKKRVIKPKDTLMSANGSPLMNPFLLGSGDVGEPTPMELQLLRTMQKNIQTYLDSHKA